MEFREYIRILRNSWPLICSAALAGLGVALIASLLGTSQYQATAQLYVSVRSASSKIDDLVQGSAFAREIVTSYVDVVRTSVVLEPVVKELGLDTTPAELAESITVVSPTDTVLINITATSTDAQLAAAIANATGESFSQVVQTQLEGDGLNDQNSIVRLTITQPAIAPTSPSSPNTAFNLALGLMLGTALGVGLAVLRSVLDTSIHSLRNTEHFSDKPFLGGVAFDPDANERPLIVHADPSNPRVESFRSLRTNLQALDLGVGGRIFVITSAGASEGKSVTSANLALSLAESGSSVALVEGNLRRPKVAEYMGIGSRGGLTDVLSGDVDFYDVTHPWGDTDLWVLTAGKVAPNPSELLGSKAMDGVLQQLRDSYDYVLIDCPPVLMVTDAAVLGKKTSGVIIVVASGSTKKQAFESALHILEAAGTHILGLIVTKLPTKGPDSYGYGIDDYGYGTGEGEQSRV